MCRLPRTVGRGQRPTREGTARCARPARDRDRPHAPVDVQGRPRRRRPGALGADRLQRHDHARLCGSAGHREPRVGSGGLHLVPAAAAARPASRRGRHLHGGRVLDHADSRAGRRAVVRVVCRLSHGAVRRLVGRASCDRHGAGRVGADERPARTERDVRDLSYAASRPVDRPRTSRRTASGVRPVTRGRARSSARRRCRRPSRRSSRGIRPLTGP